MRVKSFQNICHRLNQSGVRFLVVGGLAVNAHGYVRFTADIDLVVWLEEENVKRAFSSLQEIGYQPQPPVRAEDLADPATRQAWIQGKGMVVLKMWNEADPLSPVDIFVQEPFDFKVEYSRAKLEQFDDGLEVRVVCLGTLLRMKQEAGRPKDQLDVDQLRKLHGL